MTADIHTLITAQATADRPLVLVHDADAAVHVAAIYAACGRDVDVHVWSGVPAGTAHVVSPEAARRYQRQEGR